METNTNFAERLQKIYQFYGFKSMNDFAKAGLGYSSSEKLNRLKDATKNPSLKIIKDITDKFKELNPAWILSGIGDMTNSEKASDVFTAAGRMKEMMSNMLPAELMETYSRAKVAMEKQAEALEPIKKMIAAIPALQTHKDFAAVKESLDKYQNQFKDNVKAVSEALKKSGINPGQSYEIPSYVGGESYAMREHIEDLRSERDALRAEVKELKAKLKD
jgi:polyhydroxyalkanoate synthesis regulator phasin